MRKRIIVRRIKSVRSRRHGLFFQQERGKICSPLTLSNNMSLLGSGLVVKIGGCS